MAVFTISSAEHQSTSTIRSLYGFMTDFRNFKTILPEDKVQNFQHAEEECSFHIKGITPMTVRLREKEPYSFILYTSDGLGKFNFSLRIQFSGEAHDSGTCKVELEGDLNPVIKNMVDKPLRALVETMSQKLSELKITDGKI